MSNYENLLKIIDYSELYLCGTVYNLVIESENHESDNLELIDLLLQK